MVLVPKISRRSTPTPTPPSVKTQRSSLARSHRIGQRRRKSTRASGSHSSSASPTSQPRSRPLKPESLPRKRQTTTTSNRIAFVVLVFTMGSKLLCYVHAMYFRVIQTALFCQSFCDSFFNPVKQVDAAVGACLVLVQYSGGLSNSVEHICGTSNVALFGKRYPKVAGDHMRNFPDRMLLHTYRTYPSHLPTLRFVIKSKNQVPPTVSQASVPISHILFKMNRSTSSTSSWHN